MINADLAQSLWDEATDDISIDGAERATIYHRFALAVEREVLKNIADTEEPVAIHSGHGAVSWLPEGAELPEGALLYASPAIDAAQKLAQPISDAMMDLADRLGSEADAVDPRAWSHLLIYAPGQQDGKRYRWLTEDHADRETRAQCRSIIDSIGVRSYSATSRDIDLVMGEGSPAIDAAGAIPSWKLVPTEPTETMVVAGFESWPDEYFSSPEEWEAFEAMSGCQQAAHKAKLCYAAMLAAAPAPATSAPPAPSVDDAAGVKPLSVEQEALREVVYELAALIEKPQEATLDQWPCKNIADRECLQKAYTIARAALVAPQPPKVLAWRTEDGRVISAEQKAQAERDGGTSASSVRAYSIPLGAIAATQAGWISVKDRLPKKGEGVLCAAEFDRPGDWRIKVGGLIPDPDFNEWQVFGASWSPTHWMPLPAAPEASVASEKDQT